MGGKIHQVYANADDYKTPTLRPCGSSLDFDLSLHPISEKQDL